LLSRKVIREHLLNFERERQDVVKQRGSEE